MQRCIEQGSFSRGSNERQDYYLRHLGGVLTGAVTPGHLDAPIISVRYGLWKFKNSFHNLLWLPLHGHWLCALEKAERPAGKAPVLELASMLTLWGGPGCSTTQHVWPCSNNVLWDHREDQSVEESSVLGIWFLSQSWHLGKSPILCRLDNHWGTWCDSGFSFCF